MLNSEWLSAFVPIGSLRKNDWLAAGAGVLFSHSQTTWVVTANHVVDQIGESQIAVLLSHMSGRGVTVFQLGEIHQQHNVSWVRDQANDLACALMPVSAEVRIKTVVRENCVQLSELLPSTQCYTVGCPYGMTGFDEESAIPLVLDGVISGTSRSKGYIYTSAPTFPGNSGGPLIVVRSPFNVAGGVTLGRAPVLLAGIVLQSAAVRSPNSGDNLPALHLGVAQSIEKVLVLLDSEQAQEQIRRVRKTTQPGA